VALVAAILLAIFVLPSPWGVVLVAGAAVFEVVETGALIWWSKRRRAHVGAEALIGEMADVVVACGPIGQVRVQGELWRARCDAGAARGESVRITEIDGLTLVVEH
jgi:membrane protein implicated in regulation of membrane protease activity